MSVKFLKAFYVNGENEVERVLSAAWSTTLVQTFTSSFFKETEQIYTRALSMIYVVKKFASLRL